MLSGRVAQLNIPQENNEQEETVLSNKRENNEHGYANHSEDSKDGNGLRKEKHGNAKVIPKITAQKIVRYKRYSVKNNS